MCSEDKMEHLKNIITSLEFVALGFSGGIDSTVLLHLCAQLLGDKASAYTVATFAHREQELQRALRQVKKVDMPHYVLDLCFDSRSIFYENAADRCYHCKKMIYSSILEHAGRKQKTVILVDGSNLDDMQEDRPGCKALAELKVRMPLLEAGLRKHEIRALARKLGLDIYKKPSAPCLATRFPPGEAITEHGLQRVESAEEYLTSLGYSDLRVRYSRGWAIIELIPEENGITPHQARKINQKLLALGFQRVLLDLEGYRGAAQITNRG